MKHLQLTDELTEAASLYASGAMPEEERKTYARHLEEGCALCRSEVLELQSAIQAFAFAQPSVAPPSPAVKMRLMAQAELSASMRGLQNQAPSRRSDWIAWLISAAATAALAVVLLMNSSLRHNVELLSGRVSELESQMTGQRTTFAALTSPRFQVINLSGQGAMRQAGARVFWNPTSRSWLFYVSDLPPAAQNRTYQLWYVPASGKPVSAGVFNTNADGTAMLELMVPANIRELKAAAVTTEPAGGLPQPSGSFVLLGAL